MGRLREMLPIINLFDWANGDRYTTDDDTVVLPPELAESDRMTDEEAEKHFATSKSKGNSGKGKSQFKVDKKDLHQERTSEGHNKENIKESGLERE